MNLTLVCMTGRAEPRLDWLLLDLDSQLRAGDKIQLIVVDALGPRDVRVLADGERIPSSVTTPPLTALPKPNLWQGPYRVTDRDWWATANARNTAIALAQHEYLAFVDDRARLGDRWLTSVRAGYETREAVLAGSYDKIESAEPGAQRAVDHRRKIHPSGLRNCGGGWLYGCTFSLPTEWALEVNGLEEGCDGLTGEDYIFGLMLGAAGHRIDFVPELFVLQDRTPGNTTCKGVYACRDKGTAPTDKSHAALERFGKRSRTEAAFTPDLRELRARLARGEAWPPPAWALKDADGDPIDWYDGQKIRDMRMGE